MGVNPTDDFFCGLDGERRIRGDGLRCLAYCLVEVSTFDHAINETNSEGVGGIEQASSVEDVL